MTKQEFKKYRKIPVTIEAYQTDKEMEIETLEGTMKANKGDWIIKGVKGELYPCKPDVFEMTYEKVNENEWIIKLISNINSNSHRNKHNIN